MIELVVGAPGAGKSMYAARRARWALSRNQFVATNVEFTEDFADRFIGRHVVGARRRERIAAYGRLMHVEPSIDGMMKLRLPRCGRCKACRKGWRYCQHEERGVMILDECHVWLNARTWNVGAGAKEGRAVLDRKRLVDFMSMHRKLGWRILLISQSEEQVDAQVRRLAEYKVLLRNLRRIKVAGFQVIPFNLFIAITLWNDPSRTIVERNAWLLNRRVAGAYESMSIPGGFQDDYGDLVYLTREAAGAGAGAAGGQPAPAFPYAGWEEAPATRPGAAGATRGAGTDDHTEQHEEAA